MCILRRHRLAFALMQYDHILAFGCMDNADIIDLPCCQVFLTDLVETHRLVISQLLQGEKKMRGKFSGFISKVA